MQYKFVQVGPTIYTPHMEDGVEVISTCDGYPDAPPVTIGSIVHCEDEGGHFMAIVERLIKPGGRQNGFWQATWWQISRRPQQ